MKKNYCPSVPNWNKLWGSKLFKVMKTTLFLVLVTISQVIAIGSYSQNTRISLNAKNTTIKDVLADIENKSEFFFMYDAKKVNVDQKIVIAADNQLVTKILDVMFENRGISYSINNRQIALNSNEFIIQQTKSVSGKVSDFSGSPLPGVTVLVKGTTTGTITDGDGNYSLSNVPENAVLQFSFVGMKTQGIAIAGKTLINVILAEDAIGIDEVVAIGYGVVKKSDVTGSTTSVNSDNFNVGAIVAPEQLMQGKVSGVNITLNSGEPGANSVVRVRGGTSITAGNDPLYVIDGVPVAFANGSFSRAAEDRMPTLANNPLNMLNPSDIKSIDILKDASATAIYGSRGANGVILITTKRGENGKNSIEYDSYVSVSSLRKKIDLLSADEYRNYLKANSSKIGNWDDGGSNTDWQDEIFRSALTHSHNLALTGGNNRTNYRASFNYMNQEGIIISSGLEKIVGRINVNHKTLNDKLNIGINLTNAMLTNDNTANTESAGGDFNGGVIRDALRYNPTFPVKDANGKYTFRSIWIQNPVEQADLIQDKTETFRTLGNATLDFKITDYLSFNTNLGFTRENIGRYYYAPKASKIGEPYGGRASQEVGTNISKLLESNLNFTKKFNQIHDVSLLAGYSFQDFDYKGSFMRAEKFVSDATSYNNIDGGLSYFQPTTYRGANKLISFYGRANYNFKGKYLATASLRRDGSSRFGENNKWGLFPSAALAWRVIEESFMKNQKLISNLKLRLGYGVTGNQEIGNYNSLATLSAGNVKYMFGGKVVTAVGPDQYYNPDLKWESTSQLNFGIDFGFLDSRIFGSIDFYKKNTSDLLLRFNVPQPAVVYSTIANVGEIENKGIELELGGILIKSNELEWEISGNISSNKNKVVSLSNDTWNTKEIFTDGVPSPGFNNVQTRVIRPGESLGSFYGYEFIGLDASGKQQFSDLNKDGKILPGDDQKIIGNSSPDFIYGISSTLQYRKLSFNMLLRGSSGNDVLNATALDIESITKLPGYNTTKQAITEGLAYGEPSKFSSKWVQNASFLRLENVTLGYDINVKPISWIEKANIYITGQNLFVLTKYKGFDPEVRSGVDMTNYPRPRNILLGVRITF